MQEINWQFAVMPMRYAMLYFMEEAEAVVKLLKMPE